MSDTEKTFSASSSSSSSSTSAAAKRRRLIGIGCVTALFMFALLPVVVESFQLRDPTAPKDAATSGKPRPARTLYKDMPMRKIARIVKDIDPDELHGIVDSDGEPITASDGDDDASEDVSAEPFVFEKVHSTHFDLPSRPVAKLSQPVAKLSQPDVEQDEEEAKEEAESGEQVSSVFDPVWEWTESVLGWVPSIDVASLLEWLQSFRKREDGDNDADTPSAEEADTSPGIWSYLDRKPFNILLKYVGITLLHRDRSDAAATDRDEDDGNSSEERKPLTAQHFENLLLSMPSFVPNYTNVENIDCKRMGQIFQRQVRGERMWALQMMDASAKIPAGLLRGNANQLGDFDQCLEIRTKVKLKDDKSVKIKGKYCLASIDVEATADALRLPVHLLQGRNMLRSHLDDPAHYLPRFSTVKWAMCLPHACSANDAEEILTEFVGQFNETAGLQFSVRVDDDDCVTRTRRPWSDLIKANWQMSAAIGYFVFFLVVTVIASLNDYWQLLRLDVLLADPKTSAPETVEESTSTEAPPDNEEEGKPTNDPEVEDTLNSDAVDEKTEEANDSGTKCEACNEDHGFTHRMLMSFSLKQTTRQLFSFEPATDDDQIIYCIYGLKGLATVLLFFSLKALLAGHLPYTNRTQMTELFNSPLSVFLRVAGVLYSDVFLLTSGFFAGYKINQELQVRFRIPWMRRIGARIVRLLPTVLAVVLFTGWIWPHLGAGPQWSTLVGRNAQLCRDAAWPHLLFAQNMLPAHEQCAPHLAHIAVDMQLFVLAPVIVWLLDRNAAVGMGALGVLNAFSVGVRFARTVSERLSVVVFHGMKLTQFYRTINITLASPLQRATAHLVGLGLGVMLSQAGREVRIPKAIFVTGWLMCLWSVGWCFWAPAHLANKDYVYEPTDAAQYSTWAPLMWSLAISWIVFVVFTRNDGLMTRCLTARPLIFLSRISYQVFGVQLLVLLGSAASVRSAEAFGWRSLFDVQEIALVLGAATVCTLIFDMPLQTISRMILAQGVDEDIAAEAERVRLLEEEEDTEKMQTDEEQETDENQKDEGQADNVENEAAEEEPEKKNVSLRKVSFSPVLAEDSNARAEPEPENENDEEAEEETIEPDTQTRVDVNEPTPTENGPPTAEQSDADAEDEGDEEEEEHDDDTEQSATVDAAEAPAGGESQARFEDEYTDEDDVELTDEDFAGGHRNSDDYSDDDYSAEEDIRAQIWRNNY